MTALRILLLLLTASCCAGEQSTSQLLDDDQVLLAELIAALKQELDPASQRRSAASRGWGGKRGRPVKPGSVYGNEVEKPPGKEHHSVDKDRIKQLPGLAAHQQPRFKQYSGYLQALGSRRLHYWFVESENDPAKDPLVLWLNGGPGCSSMTGLLEENGPFRVKPDGKTLEYNEFRWNKIANLLYIESPAGTGYSYAEDGNYTVNDQEACDNNLAVLRSFYSKFSYLKRNPLYLFGQSYGGIYIPMLAVKVMEQSNYNFKGFAVGNGYVDENFNTNSLPYFMYYHGMMDRSLWERLNAECCETKNDFFCEFTQCPKAMEQVQMVAFGTGHNPYNVNERCATGAPDPDGMAITTHTGDNGHEKRTLHIPYELPKIRNYLQKRLETMRQQRGYEEDPLYYGYPCVNSTATIYYMNRQDVREALHIPDSLPGLPDWAMCGNASFDNYISNQPGISMAPQFKKVIEKGGRVLLYYGEADIATPALGGAWFAESLKQKPLGQYRPWTYEDEMGLHQIGGYVQDYFRMNFVLVPGGGHMVPKEKPRQAFEIFRKFINNENYA